MKRHLKRLGRTASFAFLIAGLLVLPGCIANKTASDGEPIAPEQDMSATYGTTGAYSRAGDEAMTEELAPVPPVPGAGEDAATVPPEDRLIIRDKSLRMEVEDVRDSVESVRTIAKDNGATVTNVNVSTDQGPIYRYDEFGVPVGSGQALAGWITVRVPADKYDAFIDSVSDLGEILWEGESIDDVTQQHVDLSARLENLKVQEARLREFFDAAQKVEEMLEIERELARVRGEIESMEAQISYLERQAARATVTIELSEPRPVVRPDGPDWGFTRAITSGLQLAANVVNAIIVVSIGALPLVAIGLALFVAIKLVLRVRRRSRDSDSDTDEQLAK